MGIASGFGGAQRRFRASRRVAQVPRMRFRSSGAPSPLIGPRSRGVRSGSPLARDGAWPLDSGRRLRGHGPGSRGDRVKASVGRRSGSARVRGGRVEASLDGRDRAAFARSLMSRAKPLVPPASPLVPPVPFTHGSRRLHRLSRWLSIAFVDGVGRRVGGGREGSPASDARVSEFNFESARARLGTTDAVGVVGRSKVGDRAVIHFIFTIGSRDRPAWQPRRDV